MTMGEQRTIMELIDRAIEVAREVEAGRRGNGELDIAVLRAEIERRIGLVRHVMIASMLVGDILDGKE